MQSGKIAPVFRQIFQATLNAKSATDSHSQQRQNPEKEPEREPTHEEALEALDRLTQQDEFQKQALRAELRAEEGKFCIFVTNSHGAQLKVIRGAEIVKMLASTGKGDKTNHLGRILDKRI